MGLVCNDRAAALLALSAIEARPLPNQARLERMRGQIPQLKIGESLGLGADWQHCVETIQAFKQATAS